MLDLLKKLAEITLHALLLAGLTLAIIILIITTIATTHLLTKLL